MPAIFSSGDSSDLTAKPHKTQKYILVRAKVDSIGRDLRAIIADIQHYISAFPEICQEVYTPTQSSLMLVR